MTTSQTQVILARGKGSSFLVQPHDLESALEHLLRTPLHLPIFIWLPDSLRNQPSTAFPHAVTPPGAGITDAAPGTPISTP